MITFGITLATYASSQSMSKQKVAHNEQKPDLVRWIIGISMLIFALLVSALMGLYQEKLYGTYGKHPEEALFYSVRSFLKTFYPNLYLYFSTSFLYRCSPLLERISIIMLNYSINLPGYLLLRISVSQSCGPI